MKTYKVRLKLVSPVHIGTGEVFSPTEYFVDEKRSVLGVIDFVKWCDLALKWDLRIIKRFMKLCKEKRLESLVELMNFMDKISLGLKLYFKTESFIKKKIPLSRGVLRRYKEIKSLINAPEELKNEFNKFEFLKTAVSVNEEIPYIPGSSIKGAIRTAVLNHFKENTRKSLQDYCSNCMDECRGENLEVDILRYRKKKIDKRTNNVRWIKDLSADPFSLIKVSDFYPVEPEKVKTKIVFVINFKKEGNREQNPYVMAEVIEPPAEFEGTITVLDSFLVQKRGIKVPLDIKTISQALRKFYSKEIEKKNKVLEKIGIGVPLWEDDGVPLCIGKFNGAEMVTIEGFRSIPVKQRGGRTKCLPYSTTVWLTSEERQGDFSSAKPLGYATLKGLNGD